MARRLLDIGLSGAGLFLLSPLLAFVLFLVWCQDRKNPFYIADRAGRYGRPFRMMKVRSMVVDAHRSGVESTGAGDTRITKVGHFVRRWKVDELPQLWNVLRGDMSLVGPRPNTMNEVAAYEPAEMRLLEVRPGITDFSSIVFADEGEIIKDAQDPDQAYRELIWPWKARLGLIYVDHRSAMLNLRLICLTALAIFEREDALRRVQKVLARCGAEADLVQLAGRGEALRARASGDNEPATTAAHERTDIAP